VTGDEQDVHTGWRHVYKYLQRKGAVARVKRFTNRRERRQARAMIKEQLDG